MANYDVVTIGGGLGGAALARALAGKGFRVLVIEQTLEFKDRVRGEAMQPWGVGEARALGVYDLLLEAGAHHQPWMDMFLGPMQMMHRDLSVTTPQGSGLLTFCHPRMQETLLAAASKAGAEVRRGVTVKNVQPGDPASVTVEEDGATQKITARLVVAADGRSSNARRCAGFPVSQDPPGFVMAGVLLDNVNASDDTALIYLNPAASSSSFIFPQGGGRARAYSAWPVAGGSRLQGEKECPQFVEATVKSGVPVAVLEKATTAGPLATFDCADTWAPHPYTQGVALIGDAASSSDPVWGQGLSLTLRDARVLRDCLLATDNWDAAGHEYAAQHDRHFGVIHEASLALERMFLRSGPEADALRARALPLIAQDPMRVPDHLTSGPDLPWSDEVRRVFFAEEATGTAQ